MRDAFQFVRETFFPNWDKRDEWSLRFVKELPPPAQGWCDRATKTIKILSSYKKRDINFLYLLVIHEVCHAVTDDYHGQKWQARMRKAAYRARKLGESQLAKMVLWEIEKSQGRIPKEIK